MCGSGLSWMLSLVSSSTVHIAVDAQIADDRISGQIRSDTGPPGSFSGWLGLICALDALLSPDMRADSSTDGREERGRPRRVP